MKKVIIVLIGLLVFIGCQEKKEENTGQKNEVVKSQDAKMDAVEEGLQIADAWVRPASKNTNTGIFFRVINNTNSNDTLVAAKTDVSEKTEIHETFTQGDDMMGMREVEYLVMEAGKVFTFKPMAHHVMLIKLNEDLPAGKDVELTLFFKHAGAVKVIAKVEDKMPSMKAADDKEKMDM